MGLDRKLVRDIVEGAIFASPVPMAVDALQQLFPEGERPSRPELQRALADIRAGCADRAIELIEVGSGYRFQVRARYAPWVGRLWEEKPQRLSRALLETLAIIAYRQPVTRAEIESIRGWWSVHRSSAPCWIGNGSRWRGIGKYPDARPCWSQPGSFWMRSVWTVWPGCPRWRLSAIWTALPVSWRHNWRVKNKKIA